MISALTMYDSETPIRPLVKETPGEVTFMVLALTGFFFPLALDRIDQPGCVRAVKT